MKTDWIKHLLLLGMAATVLLLVIRYAEFQERRQLPLPLSATLPSAPVALPEQPAADEVPVVPGEPAPVVSAQQQLVAVHTDSLDLLIDTLGGDIVRVALPRHLAKVNQKGQPFVLLDRTEQGTYVAQSGLVGANGTDSQGQRPVFSVAQTDFRLDEGQQELQVDLTSEQNGVRITKRYTLTRGSYLIELSYLIDNQSGQPWAANLYGQIKRDSQPVAADTGFGLNPFLGAALTTQETRYHKVSFDDMAEQNQSETLTGGWVAMVQHYFISAWVPDADSENRFSLRKAKGVDSYYMGFTGSVLQLAPGTQGTLKAGFYAGPKDVYALEALAPHLELTVDYGWLWWIAKPLFYFLNFINGFLNNWGFSIIVLTIVIKAIFFPLSAAQYRSMANMRKIAPMMQDLKERYGDDRQKMSVELMKLYKKEKVNPMGGCLPVLVQMPVFIALYWVLMESVELRHTAFLGWIQDLSVRDPYFVLPIIMGLTMFVQFRLNPTPPDPTQAKVMQMMPFMMTLMFMWFPAGLVLYWVCNNAISIAQQFVITRQIEAAAKA